LAAVHAGIAFHCIKNSQPREEHWSEVLSGIDQQVYCQTPFRAITLRFGQSDDESGRLGQGSCRSASRQRKRLIKWTIPTQKRNSTAKNKSKNGPKGRSGRKL
jgi:hypothetical protein